MPASSTLACPAMPRRGPHPPGSPSSVISQRPSTRESPTWRWCAAGPQRLDARGGRVALERDDDLRRVGDAVQQLVALTGSGRREQLRADPAQDLRAAVEAALGRLPVGALAQLRRQRRAGALAVAGGVGPQVAGDVLGDRPLVGRGGVGGCRLRLLIAAAAGHQNGQRERDEDEMTHPSTLPPPPPGSQEPGGPTRARDRAQDLS